MADHEWTEAEQFVMRGVRMGLAVLVQQPEVRRTLRRTLAHAVGPSTAAAIDRAIRQRARLTLREELGRWYLLADMPDGRRYRRPVSEAEAKAIDVAFVDANGEHQPRAEGEE